MQSTAEISYSCLNYFRKSCYSGLSLERAPWDQRNLLVQYRSKETPQLIGLFSPNLVITNFMQCYLYGPIG